MRSSLLKKVFGWGLALWFFGYVMGIVLFMLMPQAWIGWVLTPVGSALTLFVLLNKFPERDFKTHVMLACVWLIVAVIGDYLAIVLLFGTGTSYYQPDVFVYYLLSAALPFVSWRWKQLKKRDVVSVSKDA